MAGDFMLHRPRWAAATDYGLKIYVHGSTHTLVPGSFPLSIPASASVSWRIWFAAPTDITFTTIVSANHRAMEGSYVTLRSLAVSNVDDEMCAVAPKY